MAIQKIIRMGHPILRAPAQDVSPTELLSVDFKILLQDLYDTMEAEGGIGIAAPQIGISKKVAIISLSENKDDPRFSSVQGKLDLVIINPQIKILDQTLQGFWEGCLSLPGLRGYVERPKKIEINYLNECGDKKSFIAEDFIAQVFQHELDHLFGKLYVDRMSDTTKLSYQEEFQQFQITKT